MQEQRQEIRSLTGLRGVAACLVVFYHFLLDGTPYPRWSRPFFSHGYLAVDVFFVLSGFVMALSYGGLFRAGPGAAAYGTFMMRRLARIYPLYLVLTALGTIQFVIHALHHRTGLAGLGGRVLGNILFLQGLGLSDPIIGASWSVAAEFFVYLLFPLILLAMTGRIRTAIVIVAGVAMVVLLAFPPFGWKGTGISGPLDVSSKYSILPAVRCLAEFAIGMGLYRFAPALSKVLRGDLVASAVAVGLIGSLMVPWGDVLTVGLTAALIVCLLSRNVVTRVRRRADRVPRQDLVCGVPVAHPPVHRTQGDPRAPVRPRRLGGRGISLHGGVLGPPAWGLVRVVLGDRSARASSDQAHRAAGLPESGYRDPPQRNRGRQRSIDVVIIIRSANSEMTAQAGVELVLASRYPRRGHRVIGGPDGASCPSFRDHDVGFSASPDLSPDHLIL